ncbi:MAG: methyltransferase domain-containing protein [Synergistaceae bacterium]|nr:methyltransferase domain-containing protein [Synergistaceae bacterium]
MKLDKLYSNRFEANTWKKRNALWKILCDEFFSRYLKPSDDILDLAAGYCDFINNICRASKMGRRIAADLNPDVKLHAEYFVEVHNTPAQNLSFLDDDSIDAVFVSNFFEHLRDKDDIITILNECLRVLRVNGKILILQPNIKYIHGQYWDFFDHYTPLTEKSMCEALSISSVGVGCGYNITTIISKFLPYTTKSRMPQYDWMIKLYCHCPIAWRILGKQMFIVAEKINIINV